MKKFLAIVLTFILCFGVLSLAHAEDTAEVPEGYTPIYTAEDLYNIRNALAGKYILMNDIDLSVYENWEPIGTPDAPFTGELNGNGFLIRNLKINVVTEKSENYYGLFGVAENVPFTSVIIENGFISATPASNTVPSDINVNAGMLAGRVIGSERLRKQIRSCSATGKIEITGFNQIYVGGLAGNAEGFYSVVDCSNYTDIDIEAKINTQKIYAAGLFGTTQQNADYQKDFDLYRIANYGDILINNHDCSEKTEIIVAGVINYQLAGDVASDCYNRGNIYLSTSNGTIIASGIVGDIVNRVEESYNIGKIDVVADNNDKIGAVCGIVGAQPASLPAAPSMPQDFSIMNCYYTNSNLAPSYQDPNDEFVYHKNLYLLSDDEMKKQESFNALDFKNNWIMEENGYPVLKTLPIINADNTVNIEKTEKLRIKTGKSCISSDINIATVNENGEIVALSAGSAIITVEYEYGYTAKYNVTVVESNPPATLPEEPTEPTDPADTCPLADWWLVKIIKWVVDYVCNLIGTIIS